MRIDIRDLARRRLFGVGWFSWSWTNTYTGERTGAASIRLDDCALNLSYTVNSAARDQRITVERVPCNFGGSRPWLRCGSCYARTAVLYFAGGTFQCRRCGRVAYSCQSEDAMGRAWRKQSKLEAKLGPDWRRPKGMRRETYQRIHGAIMDCEQRRDDALAEFMAARGLWGAL